MIQGLILSYEASAPIGAYLIAAFSDAANGSKVAPATAATDRMVGTTGQIGASAAGLMVDIAKGAVPRVTLGGTVAAGDPLTANAAARAVKANVLGQRVIGFAEAPGVAGDIITYTAAPGTLGA